MCPRMRISSAHLLTVLLTLALSTLSSSADGDDGGEGVVAEVAVATAHRGWSWRGSGGGGDAEWSGGLFHRRRLCGGSQRQEGDAWCEAFVGVGIRSESVVLYDVIVGLPTVLFIVFLASQLRSSVRKLHHSHGRNHIMITYYAFLWLVCVLNVLRCCLQMWQASPLNHLKLWNALWLTTRFGMTFLEVSVIVFLAQGYRADAASGGRALARTLAAATVVAGVDLVVKLALIFGGGVELFVEQQEAQSPSYYWAKWGYWAGRNAIFAAVYAAVVTLPHTRHRDVLPARPAFFRYAALLLTLYAAGTVGALCVAAGAGWGYCLAGLCNFAYYVGYPPLLYLTFLADFFREDEFDLENAYYSEMEDAGYFDDDVGNFDY